MVSRLDSPFLHLFAIALSAFAVYAGTLDHPFHFDDYPNIVENPVVGDFSYFLHPSKADNYKVSYIFRSRYAGFLTFALNYRAHGLDVRGYHAVNILLHAANAVLLYLLVALTMRTPHLAGAAGGGRAATAAFFSGLLFAVHPVQTQAVTYIVQRFTSQATMFYLLSLVLYAGWRLAKGPQGGGRPPRSGATGLYAASLLAALAAFKSKEIAVTLPLALCLYEFLFFTGPKKGRLLRLAPFFLLALSVPLGLAGTEDPFSEGAGFSRVQTQMPRLHYLMTELRVMATYLRLLLLPVNQNLDYDYPVYGSPFTPGVPLSLLLVAVLISAAVVLLKLSAGRPMLRLVSFGVFWFFLALLPESSLIPIVDVIFEHRVYLPSVGFAMSASVLPALLPKASSGRRAYALLAAAAVLLAVLAHQRNLLWRDDMALWGDAAGKSARKGRPLNNLGLALREEGRHEEATAAFRRAIEVDPAFAEAYVNLAIEYWDAGLTSEAVRMLKRSIDVRPSSEANYNLGVAYMKLGRPDLALGPLRQAVLLDRGSAEAYGALGAAYLAAGDANKAVRILREGAERLPGQAAIYATLVKAHLARGDREAARRALFTLEGLDPGKAAELRPLVIEPGE